MMLLVSHRWVVLQAPYIIYVEVVEVADLQTSPVPMKVTSALRQTRSEENIAGTNDCASSCVAAERHVNSYSVYSQHDEDSADCWSQEDDEITQQVKHERSAGLQARLYGVYNTPLRLQYIQLRRPKDRDEISQVSQESSDSREPPVLIEAKDIRRRLSESLSDPRHSTFSRTSEDPSAHVLKVGVARLLPGGLIGEGRALVGRGTDLAWCL